MTVLPNDGEDLHRIRAGAALRALGHAFVGHHADDELLDELAVELETFTERMSAGDPRARDAVIVARASDE